MRTKLQHIALATLFLGHGQWAWSSPDEDPSTNAPRHRCSQLITEAISRIRTPPGQFEHWVRETTQTIMDRGRPKTQATPAIDPKDVWQGFQRALSSENHAPTTHFTHPHGLDEFSWQQLINNLERMRDFFYGHVDYASFKKGDLVTAFIVIAEAQNRLNPAYFEIIVEETFALLRRRLHYAAQAAHNVSELRNHSPVQGYELGLALAVLRIKTLMPDLGALALQSFRLENMNSATYQLLPIDKVNAEALERYLKRNTGYHDVLRSYLSLEETIKLCENMPGVKRAIEMIAKLPPGLIFTVD